MTPFLQGQWVNTGIYLDLRHGWQPLVPSLLALC